MIPELLSCVAHHTSHGVRKHIFGYVRPAKIQISLRIRAVWSESSLSAFWVIWFVLRFYGPVNPMGSCRARSVYLTTQSSKRLTSIVHILSPETDNCSSWISGRDRMTVENISWSISTKECCRPRRGLNPRPPGLQSDGASNWATEAGYAFWVSKDTKFLHEENEGSNQTARICRLIFVFVERL